jgi:hypothetical protein
MPKLGQSWLAIFVLGAIASGCSPPEPTPRDFTLINQRPAKPQDSGNMLQAAEAACKEEAETKGIKSIKAIFSRFRKGAADEAYIACMKQRGYDVKQ